MSFVSKRKIFKFLRKKKETSVITPVYDKFLNLFMRKGLKNRSIKIFYDLLRAHKKRIRFLCVWKYNSSSLNIFNQFLKLPTFPIILNSIFKIITIRLELKVRKFKKSEVVVPAPVSPRRGLRLGLDMLLKNSKLRIQKTRLPRKIEFLYRFLDEIWDTFHGKSLTCKDVLDFTTKVLDNSENYRSTQLFPVKFERRLKFFDKEKRFKIFVIEINKFKKNFEICERF